MRAQRRAEGKWKRTGSTEIFVQMEQEVNKQNGMVLELQRLFLNDNDAVMMSDWWKSIK